MQNLFNNFKTISKLKHSLECIDLNELEKEFRKSLTNYNENQFQQNQLNYNHFQITPRYIGFLHDYKDCDYMYHTIHRKSEQFKNFRFNFDDLMSDSSITNIDDDIIEYYDKFKHHFIFEKILNISINIKINGMLGFVEKIFKYDYLYYTNCANIYYEDIGNYNDESINSEVHCNSNRSTILKNLFFKRIRSTDNKYNFMQLEKDDNNLLYISYDSNKRIYIHHMEFEHLKQYQNEEKYDGCRYEKNKAYFNNFEILLNKFINIDNIEIICGDIRLEFFDYIYVNNITKKLDIFSDEKEDTDTIFQIYFENFFRDNNGQIIKNNEIASLKNSIFEISIDSWIDLDIYNHRSNCKLKMNIHQYLNFIKNYDIWIKNICDHLKNEFNKILNDMKEENNHQSKKRKLNN